MGESKAKLQVELDSIKEQEKQLNKRKDSLMKKIKQGDMFIDDNGVIKYRERVWAVAISYSYLCEYLTESRYPWKKNQGSGMIEISEDIVKYIVNNSSNTGIIQNWLNNLKSDHLRYARDDVKVTGLSVADSSISKDCDDEDYTEININEFNLDKGMSIVIEVETDEDLECYEEFDVEIKKCFKDELDIEEDDSVLE